MSLHRRSNVSPLGLTLLAVCLVTSPTTALTGDSTQSRAHRVALVSPTPVDLSSSLGFSQSALARDPDGHGLRFVVTAKPFPSR